MEIQKGKVGNTKRKSWKNKKEKSEIQKGKLQIQSGASSPAKHGVPYFSAVYGSIEDPVAAPGPCKPQVG